MTEDVIVQHVQIGKSSFERNEHGAVIEHSRWLPSEIDEAGRCCGRKPILYKRPPRMFCSRCGREYSPDGKQVSNWAFSRVGPLFINATARQDLYESPTPEAK